MSRPAIVAAWLLVATVWAHGPAFSQPAQPVVERDAVDMAPAAGQVIERIDVDNRLGDVRIEGHDLDSLSILAIKRGRDAETVDRLKVSLVPDASGGVSVRTALLAGKEARAIAPQSIRVDLVVRVPRNARVSARAWKGLVAAVGIDNGANLFADNGDIEVSQVSGQVITETSHGTQRLAEVFGNVEARAIEGDLALDLIRGDRLSARVQRGQVVAERVRAKEVRVRVFRGNVRLEAERMLGGTIEVVSYWGDIEVRLQGKAPVQVAAKSGTGVVSLSSRFRRQDQGGGVVAGYLGSGGSPAELDLRTRVGKITVAEF